MNIHSALICDKFSLNSENFRFVTVCYDNNDNNHHRSSVQFTHLPTYRTADWLKQRNDHPTNPTNCPGNVQATPPGNRRTTELCSSNLNFYPKQTKHGWYTEWSLGCPGSARIPWTNQNHSWWRRQHNGRVIKHQRWFCIFVFWVSTFISRSTTEAKTVRHFVVGPPRMYGLDTDWTGKGICRNRNRSMRYGRGFGHSRAGIDWSVFTERSESSSSA